MVFTLDVEQWTSSTPSVGSSRVLGSLPNQSYCVLWIWRRHSTASPRGVLWGVLRDYGVSGPLIRAVCSLYDRSQSLVHIARRKSDLFPVRVGLPQRTNKFSFVIKDNKNLLLIESRLLFLIILMKFSPQKKNHPSFFWPFASSPVC